MPSDYKVVDMPTALSRDVKMPDPDGGGHWIRDESWYQQTREIYRSLVRFLEDNQLLSSSLDTSNIDAIVLKFSDLNELGQAFIRSGADDKWLALIDRPGTNRSPSDVSYLEKALRRITRVQETKAK